VRRGQRGREAGGRGQGEAHCSMVMGKPTSGARRVLRTWRNQPLQRDAPHRATPLRSESPQALARVREAARISDADCVTVCRGRLRGHIGGAERAELTRSVRHMFTKWSELYCSQKA
jgi:hypothetical protein